MALLETSQQSRFRVDMKIVRQTAKKWELYDLANDPSKPRI